MNGDRQVMECECEDIPTNPAGGSILPEMVVVPRSLIEATYAHLRRLIATERPSRHLHQSLRCVERMLTDNRRSR